MQKQSKKVRVPSADNTHIVNRQPRGLPPYQAAARRKLIQQAERDAERYVIAFDVQKDHAPALRSVIEEMDALVVARLNGKTTAAQESALTAASVALGALRASVLPFVPEVDPNFPAEYE